MRILLDEGGVDLHRRDSRGGTTLHHAARCSSHSQCTVCLVELLHRSADPCVVDDTQCTPLDAARSSNCIRCVRVLENRVKLWQGWVDRYDQFLVFPTWKTVWFVLLQDRPVVGLRTWICAGCSMSQDVPPGQTEYVCRVCGSLVRLAPTLQIAIYEPKKMMDVMVSPDVAVPVYVKRFGPGTRCISAKAMECSWGNVLDSLFKGSFTRALQNTAGSGRNHNVLITIPDEKHDLCLRLETDTARAELLKALGNPVAAMRESLNMALTDVIPAETGSSRAPRAWACRRCTLLHEGEQARALFCAVCEAPRDSEASVEDSNHASTHPATSSTSPSLASSSSMQYSSITTPSPLATVLPTSEDNEEGMCIVCLDNQADAAVVPCGHMCGCIACLQGIKDSKCPVCRGPISSIIRIYRS